MEARDTLVVGYTAAPPFLVQEHEHKHGICFWLWEQVAREMELDYTLKEMPFEQILEGLDDGSVDISINPLTMTAERSNQFNFTSPFYVANSTLVVKKISRTSVVLKTLKRIFSLELLSGIIILLIIIGTFGVLTWFFERKKNPDDFRPDHKGLWDGLWWSTVTMTTVGYGDKTPKSFGGKIIALIWMFTALLVVSGFTGSIASSILSSRQEMKVYDVNTLKDHHIGTMQNTSCETFLRSRHYKYLHPYSSIEDGLQAVESDEIKAFIYDEPILQYRLRQHGEGELELHNSSLNRQLYAFGISKKNHDLVHDISRIILEQSRSIEWSVLLNEYGLQSY